jgi:hypothetical protein
MQSKVLKQINMYIALLTVTLGCIAGVLQVGAELRAMVQACFVDPGPWFDKILTSNCTAFFRACNQLSTDREVRSK